MASAGYRSARHGALTFPNRSASRLTREQRWLRCRPRRRGRELDRAGPVDLRYELLRDRPDDAYRRAAHATPREWSHHQHRLRAWFPADAVRAALCRNQARDRRVFGITMKAALIARYGSNDLVKVADTAVPVIGSMDLLVQVHAASVNPVDVKTRDGQLKTLLKYRFPLVLGNDLSGVVSDVGAQVTRFKKGDAVYARLDTDRIGTFAEFAVVREGAAALKPTNVTFEEAASFPLVALTAWQALVEIGKLGAGQRVLIHAGSGGVGSVAIQLARHLGATVFTTVGQRNVELVKRLGADVPIDYRSARFEDVAKDCDVVLDSAGGETLVRW